MKKYFHPSPENNHQPRFFEKQFVKSLLVIILLLEVIFFMAVFVIIPNSGLTAAVMPNALFEFSNIARKTENVAPLSRSPLLDKAATLKAKDMATRSYFSHISPTGEEPWKWLQEVGYEYKYAGENLALNYVDSESTVEAWLESPTHRANLLNSNYSEIGIGVARGQIDGRESDIIVQFFGKPKNEQVLGASVEAKNPGFFGGVIQKIISSPQKSLNTIYFAVIFLVIVALSYGFTHKKTRNKKSIAFGGFLIIFLLLLSLYLNNFTVELAAEIPDELYTASVINL